MIYLDIVITLLSNFILLSWYTRRLTKELKIFEDRIDKKLRK